MPSLDTTPHFLPLFDPNNEHYSKRYLTWYGGRGGMKSWQVARGLLMRGQREKKKILCTREFQNSISESVMAVLEAQAEMIGVHNFYIFKNQEIVGKNGTQFIFKGIRQNINSIKSFEDIDIVWNEEAQATSQKSIDVLYPTIRKPGSQIITTFNPSQPTDPIYVEAVLNHDPSEAYLCKVNYLDNPFIDSEFVRRAEKIKKADPESYAHIYLGEFDTKYSGAVYAKFVREKQILDGVKHDPDYPVYTAWDKGFGDATAIIFYQVGNGEIYIVDYFEDNQEDIRHYCEVLAGKKIIVDERDMATGEVSAWRFGEEIEEHKHRQAYKYHQHYGPHDMANKLMEAGGRSIVDQARKFGVRFQIMPATEHMNSEQALRQTLPRCWINRERCGDLVKALMSYHYEYDQERGRYSKLPYHDWSSHACDAAELMARTWRDVAVSQKDLDRRAVVSDFHRKRVEHNLIKADPYRTRKR